LLLVASCIFYMAFVPAYVLILFSLITLDFFLAPIIARTTAPHRLHLLWISISANLGMLFFFKYFNFFNINVAALASFLHWNYSPSLLTIALPLGLSFHVFQSLSYVIEVYRGKYVPERNYLVYALYVMFFPQLVAGPIERPQHLLPQFRKAHPFDAVRVRRGLERMLWGFFKKLVIADNIAPIVDQIYSGNPTNGPLIIFTAFLFTYQLYCDFSGYSDIALGAALILGYDLMENFDRPFAGRTIAELWRRWHISLSSWLRDYLFTPLFWSGRHRKYWAEVSVFTSFVLIGLWHGANWTYVVFGALNGLYVTFGSLSGAWRKRSVEILGIAKMSRMHHAMQILITFALFAFCLIFFRASDVKHAWQLISHLGNGLGDINPIHSWFAANGPIDKVHIGVVLVGIIFLELVQYRRIILGSFHIFDRSPKALRYAWYYALFFGIIFFGRFAGQPFIYFRF